MSKAYDIAVVGATGLIGETLIQLLEERGFPVGKLYALAGERSIGTRAMGDAVVAALSAQG